MVNEPSVDAPSLTLTVSAFVEMDMAATIPKAIMDDLMIMNDLFVVNPGVMSWSSFGTIVAAFSQNTFTWNCSFLASSSCG